MAGTIQGSDIRRVIQHVIRERTEVQIPCARDNQVHAYVLQLNRWRQRVIDDWPELSRVKFLKRFNPPRVVVEYWDIVDTPLLDGNGNPLGFTLADLEAKEREEQEATRQAEREADRPSTETEQAYARRLARELNLSLEDIAPPEPDAGLTEIERNALDAAARQKGRELTAEEREHILHSVEDDSLDIDL